MTYNFHLFLALADFNLMILDGVVGGIGLERDLMPEVASEDHIIVPKGEITLSGR